MTNMMELIKETKNTAKAMAEAIGIPKGKVVSIYTFLECPLCNQPLYLTIEGYCLKCRAPLSEIEKKLDEGIP